MKFTYDGTEHDFDFNTLSVVEARIIKRHTGMGLKGFLRGVNDYDVDAWMALVLVAKKRNNEAVTWDDLQDADFLEVCNSHAAARAAELEQAVQDAMDKHDDAEESPDPPEPAKPPAKKKTSGKTRKSG